VYIKGTGIMYFYWDAEKRSFMCKSGGELKAEVVAGSNPFTPRFGQENIPFVYGKT
jgi:hypothetical protein